AVMPGSYPGSVTRHTGESRAVVQGSRRASPGKPGPHGPPCSSTHGLGPGIPLLGAAPMTIALDPTDRNKRPRPPTHLARAAAAHIRAFVDGTTPERKAKEMFEDDKVTDVILKAASTPAAISNVGWAGALAGQAVEDSVMAITSSSAAADLMSRGLKLNFDG